MYALEIYGEFELDLSRSFTLKWEGAVGHTICMYGYFGPNHIVTKVNLQNQLTNDSSQIQAFPVEFQVIFNSMICSKSSAFCNVRASIAYLDF